MKKRLKISWILLGTSLLLIMLQCFNTIKIREMEEQLIDMKKQVQEMNGSVNEQIAGISFELQDILESQATAVLDFSYEILSVDYGKGQIKMKVSIVPKEYVEGMRVGFVMEGDGNENVRKEAVLQNDHTFMTQMTVPISSYLKLSVSLGNGTSTINEVLEEWYGLDEEYTLQVDSSYFDGSCKYEMPDTARTEEISQDASRSETADMENSEEGVLIFSGEVLSGINSASGKNLYPVSGIVTIKINEEIKYEARMKMTKADAFGVGEADAGYWDAAVSIEEKLKAAPGSKISIEVMITDNYHNTTERVAYYAMIEENGELYEADFSAE